MNITSKKQHDFDRDIHLIYRLDGVVKASDLAKLVERLIAHGFTFSNWSLYFYANENEFAPDPPLSLSSWDSELFEYLLDYHFHDEMNDVCLHGIWQGEKIAVRISLFDLPEAVLYIYISKSSVILRPFVSQDQPLLRRWLSAPHVAPWYHQLEGWLREAANEDGAYDWIHHFIAESEGQPIGFCQYYAYRLGGESWHGSTETEGAYSIDYLIGESSYLGKGLGRQMVTALIKALLLLSDARWIIARPETGNLASHAVLRSCGFRFDEENQLYIYDLAFM